MPVFYYKFDVCVLCILKIPLKLKQFVNDVTQASVPFLNQGFLAIHIHCPLIMFMSKRIILMVSNIQLIDHDY